VSSDSIRKLATIVALDVAGYSARTEADEAKTTAEVAALRKLIEGIAQRHGGRVFNTAGDGFMLEFGSSLAAVEAAFELAETCEPKVRVGVHLGDVVVQPNGDLLGHGVNVAARLMAQSPPGAALVSGAVRQTIRGPVAERLQSRGTFKLDKMAETIEAFALAGLAVVAHARMTPAEPVLAVLPFDNLSNDQEMQFFSDGVSEEILQVLARGAGLKVIGRSSAFQFRGARKGEAAQALKATHVLDGAVRKAGVRLRVSAQLTEAAGGAALWSERYDRELADVFAMQDDIAAKVASSLRAVLQPQRNRQVDPHAYDLYLKASQERSLITPDGFLRAQVLLEEVVALAPDFTDAWALLGTVRTMLLPYDRDSVGAPQHNAALAATRRALALDPDCAIAYWNLTNLKPAFADYAEKIDLSRRGIELAPNGASLAMSMSASLLSVGRCKEAFDYAVKSTTLDPMNPMNATAVAALLENAGREQDAHAYLDDVMKAQPPSLWTAVGKFLLFHNASRFEEAAAYLDASILAGNEELTQLFRFALALPSLPPDNRAAIFQSMLAPGQDRALALTSCTAAARFGCADLAFDHLFAALDAGRSIAGAQVTAVHGSRGSTLNVVFPRAEAKAFRADKRFARFCARIGLVDYWRTSGIWPDCAAEVPCDFKAECEKAMHEAAKA
jgi:adenylate cyclase